jgi:hypothetical protein
MNTYSNVDTCVSNYSILELTTIIGLDINNLHTDDIAQKTNMYISKFKDSNPEMYYFFIDIQRILLDYCESENVENDNNDSNSDTTETTENIEGDEIEGFTNMNSNNQNQNQNQNQTQNSSMIQEQTKNWIQNIYLKPDDTIENIKNTDRQNKIDVYSNDHVPMKKEQLGVFNSYNVPVVQDTLNPNLKNTISRFINLDSQFRQYTSGTESSATDYTLDLSDPLKNVLNMKLFSFQIPYTWYLIDYAYGNTCFWISHEDYNVTINVEPGNYDQSELVDALNTSFTNAGFEFASPPVTYNINNGKITLKLLGGVYKQNDIVLFTINPITMITFYDYTSKLQCKTNCVNSSFYLNQTLGWIMGFRNPYVHVDPNGNTGTAVVDVIGTKYLILVVDDYNQNHVNNTLVSITEYSSVLKVPSYYSPDLPYICLPANTNNIDEIVNDDQNNGLLLAGKINMEYTPTVQLVPSAPRTLTQAQLYTINEINKNRNNNTNYRSKAPTSTDILSIIPIKSSGAKTGDLLVEISGSLQDNVRTYFGPVNIDRMRVKLLNDKGIPLNMNGVDWCVTIICDCLYQY